MRSRSTAFVTAPIACATLVLAACGGSSAPSPAGITTATPRAVATTVAATGAAIDPRYAEWAGAICESTAHFDEAVAAEQDSIDPRTLPLPNRVARGSRRYQAYVASLQKESDVIAALKPPAGADGYHRALQLQISELQRLFAQAISALAAATSSEQVDATGTQLQSEVEKLANGMRLAERTLSPEASDALAATPRCGQLLG